MRIKWPKVVGYGALAMAVLIVTFLVALTLVDWNRLRGPLGHYVSARVGREVVFSGPLRVQIWSRTPTVTISGLQIGNPLWEAPRPFARIEKMQIQLNLHSLLHGHFILSRVALLRPEIYLHREKSGRANWTFEDTAPSDDRAPPPLKLPAIRNALIDSGTLVLVDEMRRMNLTGTIEAHEYAAASDLKPFRVAAHGVINKEPFQVELSGGALHAISPDHPYPFTVNMQAGQHEIKAEGAVLKPFDLSGLELQVAARGRDLAELYYVTQLALPNTPPYQVQAHILRNGQHFELRNIKGSLGATDIGGTVDVDASHKRPAILAKLFSRHLYMKDLGAITGSRVATDASSDSTVVSAAPKIALHPPKADAARLFPDAHLQVSRVQGMDAELTFTADTISAGSVPFTHASLTATLKDGVLSVHPARFDMPQGRLSALVSIDTHPKVPSVHMDVRAINVELDQLKGKAPTATAPLGGIFQARAIISGKGDSLRSLMAGANGTVTGVIPHGDIRAAFAELTGVDVAKGVGLLLKKPDDRAPIHCGVAQFDIQDGTARADNIIMDTQNVLITGSGAVELGSEKLDLAIEGHPKKFRLLRVRSPIKIEGHVLKPTFELDAGHLVKQGGIAVVLGTVLTPLAAILAFVDPGLAKDQNCAQLSQPPSEKSAASPAPDALSHGTRENLAHNLPAP